MFEREVSKEIASIYHNGLLNISSIEVMRRSNNPYYDKFLKASGVLDANIFGVRCGGCKPILQSDWISAESVSGTIHSQFFGAYKKELKSKNYVCFSRCGNESFPSCRQDGRIDIRFLKINELWDYVTMRLPSLIENDRDNLLKIDPKNERPYQRIFNDILIPISKQQQS